MCSIFTRRTNLYELLGWYEREKLIPVLGSQPAGVVSHKPDGRLPLTFARPAVSPTTLKRAATSLLLGEQRHGGCEQFA